ncbi:MAG: endonuclease/exonuclease/phosphatase family protein [Myxococcales bacterium]|nr:endonuclease/exonuclease/phosphatase family protein [Myxococcales bacterium]USN50675.1 MAG: endonuclease/exonuclease/phosphatase family protein [Myxococcales bacterium]
MLNGKYIFCLSFFLTICLHVHARENTKKISVLSYNVAGLPDFISQSHPKRYTKLISPLLNEFDVVLVQEDFIYHRDLISRSRHRYLSKPDCDVFSKGGHHFGFNAWHCLVGLGDGLNRLSQIPFLELKRVTWKKCSGYLMRSSDCLTTKGFSFASHKISNNYYVHIYNLHADAGSHRKDKKARLSNFRQLAQFINQRSTNQAVIVAGDTNSLYSDENSPLEEFLLSTGLRDAWVTLGSSSHERIDKIFFRSSETLSITPLSHKVESKRFVTKDNEPLSDHEAVSVNFMLSYRD